MVKLPKKGTNRTLFKGFAIIAPRAHASASDVKLPSGSSFRVMPRETFATAAAKADKVLESFGKRR